MYFKVVGKAFYETTYEGKVYKKVVYSLDSVDKSKYKNFEGIVASVVVLPANDHNVIPRMGDTVAVSYDVYNGQRKATAIFVVK